jgi:hypothetical protein
MLKKLQILVKSKMFSRERKILRLSLLSNDMCTCMQVGIDFSQVRYFTILGFSDGGIDITAN